MRWSEHLTLINGSKVAMASTAARSESSPARFGNLKQEYDIMKKVKQKRSDGQFSDVIVVTRGASQRSQLGKIAVAKTLGT